MKLPAAKTAGIAGRGSFVFCYTALDGSVFARVARNCGNKINKLETLWNFFAETNVAQEAVVRRRIRGKEPTQKADGLFRDQVGRVDVIAVESRVVVLHVPDKLLGSGSLRERCVVHERNSFSLSCVPADIHAAQTGLLNVAKLAMNGLQNLGEIGFAGHLVKFLVG